MDIKNKFVRYLAMMVITVLGLSFFTFAPIASAAPAISLVSTPSEEFNIPDAGDFDLEYELTLQGNDVDVLLYMEGPMEGTPVEEEVASSIEYTEGPHTISWDGLMGGVPAEPGTYDYRLYAAEIEGSFQSSNELTGSVEVLDPPLIRFKGTPASNYDTSVVGDYEIDIEMFLQGNDIEGSFYMEGPGGTPAEEEVDTFGGYLSGDVTVSWDGTLDGDSVDPGDYSYRITCNEIEGPAESCNELTGTVTVLGEESPAISDLGVTIDPFSPDDDGLQDTTTVSFKLSQDADVTITVEDDNGVEIKELRDSQSMTAGTINTTWDGTDTGDSVVNDGTYTFVVYVSNSAGDDTDEVDVEVDTTPVSEPSEQCADYTDVDADHPDCDAIEYVQSIGAMTGNPDGTFAPNDNLQRDQIAKISLETFDLFDEAEDYCNDSDPFPDVPVAQWSYQYICRGVALGMITGYLGGEDAGYYRPARSVNRVEFLALILRNLEDDMPSVNSSSYDDVPSGEWYSGYAKYSFDNELFTGKNVYPTQFTTRLEVAKVIYKLHQLGKL